MYKYIVRRVEEEETASAQYHFVMYANELQKDARESERKQIWRKFVIWFLLNISFGRVL
jgi:hypothetical protein